MEEPVARAKFLKLYANLPLGLRDEVILVLDKRGPITWNVAYVEVNNKTALSRTILEKLSDLGVL